MVEITSIEDLESWLNTRSWEDAMVIAIRAALRVLPFMNDALDKIDASGRRKALVMPAFFSSAAVWLAVVKSDPTRRDFHDKIDTAAREASDYKEAPMAASAIYAIRMAQITKSETEDDAPLHAAGTASEAASVAMNSWTDTGRAERLSASIWKAVTSDVNALQNGRAPQTLAIEALWPNGVHEWAESELKTLGDRLHGVDEHWEVWTDWYRRRLHGGRLDQPFEEIHVRINDELWRQGPKAVNTEIARLIGEHKVTEAIGTASATSTAHGVGASIYNLPALPDERGTPVHFEFRDGALHRAPPEPPHPPEDRRASAERAWQALRQMLDDFLTSGGGSQNPRLKTVLNRCGDAMGAGFDVLDTILLGVYSARLQGFADRADEVLMPEDAAELVALNAQFGLFLAQFPEWAEYASGISDGFGTPEAEQKAVADLTEAIDQIKRNSPDLISTDAREGLVELAEAATPQPSPENPTPIAPPVERRSYLRAGRSALLAFASDAMASARKGTLKGIESGFEKITMATLVGIAGYTTALATGLPVEFGWLAGVVTFLKSALAKADGGAAADREDQVSDDDLIDT